MDRDLFRITLQGAVEGNPDDFERIIDLYAPLIEHHCDINSKMMRIYISTYSCELPSRSANLISEKEAPEKSGVFF